MEWRLRRFRIFFSSRGEGDPEKRWIFCFVFLFFFYWKPNEIKNEMNEINLLMELIWLIRKGLVWLVQVSYRMPVDLLGRPLHQSLLLFEYCSLQLFIFPFFFLSFFLWRCCHPNTFRINCVQFFLYSL